MKPITAFTLLTLLMAGSAGLHSAEPSKGLAKSVTILDASSLRGKVLCGYQGWFRCPGDAADMGWVHWSRDSKHLTPEKLTFEMWPDVSEFPVSELFAAPGFTDAAGKPMSLFSSDHPGTVQRHFEWMRDSGIDGVWLQHFVVDLPGGPAENRYPSRRRVMDHVRSSATKTGRLWALAFDIAGMKTEKIYEVLTREWQKLVDEGVTKDPNYVHEGGKPVVEIFGFYKQATGNYLTTAVANQLLDFLKAPGPYAAYVVAGGDWDWRRNSDPEWQMMLHRLDAYSPWNPGNTSKDSAGVIHASMGYWAEDKKECEKRGQLWLPIVYPGFSWDNLQHKPAGSTIIPRRKGQFLWEQFYELSKLGADSVCIAMFDEVDEATAIFKITNAPPTQAHFVTLEGMPSDWYLRLVGEGARLLRAKMPVPQIIPIRP